MKRHNSKIQESIERFYHHLSSFVRRWHNPQKKHKKWLHGTTQDFFLGISELSSCLQSDGLKIHWFPFKINNFNGFPGPLNFRNNLVVKAKHRLPPWVGTQRKASHVAWSGGAETKGLPTLPLRLPRWRFMRNRITTTNISTLKAI